MSFIIKRFVFWIFCHFQHMDCWKGSNVSCSSYDLKSYLYDFSKLFWNTTCFFKILQKYDFLVIFGELLQVLRVRNCKTFFSQSSFNSVSFKYLPIFEKDIKPSIKFVQQHFAHDIIDSNAVFDKNATFDYQRHKMKQ